MKKLIFILICLVTILIGTCSCSDDRELQPNDTILVKYDTILVKYDSISYDSLINQMVDTILVLNYDIYGDIVVTHSRSDIDSLVTISYTEKEWRIKETIDDYTIYPHIHKVNYTNYTQISEKTYSSINIQRANYNILDYYVDRENEKLNPKYSYSMVWQCHNSIVRYIFTYEEWLTALKLRETGSDEYNQFMHDHDTKYTK